jgi:hypothetical protein
MIDIWKGVARFVNISQNKREAGFNNEFMVILY